MCNNIPNNSLNNPNTENGSHLIAAAVFSARFLFDKGIRSVGGGVVVWSALVECAELLCNFGISFEKYLLKQVW